MQPDKVESANLVILSSVSCVESVCEVGRIAVDADSRQTVSTCSASGLRVQDSLRFVEQQQVSNQQPGAVAEIPGRRTDHDQPSRGCSSATELDSLSAGPLAMARLPVGRHRVQPVECCLVLRPSLRHLASTRRSLARVAILEPTILVLDDFCLSVVEASLGMTTALLYPSGRLRRTPREVRQFRRSNGPQLAPLSRPSCSTRK